MGEWIPIVGTLTGLITTVVFFYAVIRVAQGPIGDALARRILGRGAGGDPDLRAELHGLQEQVDRLQHQLEEAHERLDFAERLLTQGKSGASALQEP
jgi:hypothetical protein